MDPVDPVLLDSLGRGKEESYILKYRRKHLFKSDLEISFRKWYAGINFQYNSIMIRVDEAFVHDFFGNVILPGFPDYWRENRHGYFLSDLRLGWNLNEHYRISVQMKNLFNVEYLGRPGDLGPPRQLSLQLKFTF
jgi:iron complex outermembrane receptor protein